VRKGDFFMQKNTKSTKISLFGSLKVMTMAAMLTAMSVVIGIFCKSFLNFGEGLYRITFENLPILLSGIMFGPIVGGVVGAATDIISYLLSPQTYSINIIVTLGAAAVGLVSGVVSRYVLRKKTSARIVFSCLAAHAVGSMIIKPIGLFAFYGWAVLWRVPMYLVIAPIEIILICAMRRNSTAKKLIDGKGDTA